MIKCELLKNFTNDPDDTDFNVDIEGDSETVLIELIRIMGALVKAFRQITDDEKIEKQLVLCVKGGFDFADGKLRKEE